MTTEPFIRWVSAPPDPSPRTIHPRKDFVEQLKLRPGVWAQFEPGIGHRSHVAGGFKRDYPGTEALLRSRGTKPYTYDCYVRWVGP